MHPQKGITPVVLIIIVGLLALSGGTIAGLVADKARQINAPSVPLRKNAPVITRENSTTSAVTNSDSESIPLSTGPTLCIPLFNFQTNLPLTHFSYRTADYVAIYKDGAEYLLLYPLIPDLDITKEYGLTDVSFIAKNSKFKVYRKEKDGKASYAVAAPLPFFVSPMSEDQNVEADTEQLINSIQPNSRCPSPNPGLYISQNETQAKTDFEQWVNSLSPTPKAHLDRALQTAFTWYQGSDQKDGSFPTFFGCESYLVGLVIDALTLQEKQALEKIIKARDPYAPLSRDADGDFIAQQYVMEEVQKKFGSHASEVGYRTMPSVVSGADADPSEGACAKL